MSPPWGLPLPKVWNLLVTISDQKYVCLVHFSMNCFLNEEQFFSVSSVSLSLPDRLTSIRLLPHQHEAPGSEVDFFFETTRALANSWNCALGNCGTFNNFWASQKVDLRKWRHLSDPLDHTTIGLTPLCDVRPNVKKRWHICKTIVPLVGCRAIDYLRYEWWDCNFQMRRHWGQCWSALFLVPTKLVLIDW